jgi:hypothetical protein
MKEIERPMDDRAYLSTQKDPSPSGTMPAGRRYCRIRWRLHKSESQGDGLMVEKSMEEVNASPIGTALKADARTKSHLVNLELAKPNFSYISCDVPQD